MKIVRIFLKNLNSLKGEHIIDLESEPFSNSGIFAITGQTGSGKSTILDAITLALYGKAARYGGEPSPDDVMSRHTGECQAEVVFDVPKGRYRAVWHLKRAGNKPTGKLQSPKRYVYDSQDNVIAQNIKAADEVIENLTGLDGDHFFRSVLLAQGDFAKFLKAKSEERASLLESLTGTSIYTELSLTAHEITSEKEKKVQLGEEALRQIALLTDEIRQAKQQEGIALSKSIQIKEEEEKILLENSNRGDQLVILQKKLSNLHQDRRNLDAARVATDSRLKQLNSHKKTLSFFPDIIELDRRINEHDKKREEWGMEETQLIQAKCSFRAGYNTVSSMLANLILEDEKVLTNMCDQKLVMDTDLAGLDKWFKENEKDQFLDGAMADIVGYLTSLSDRHIQEERIIKGQNSRKLQVEQAILLLTKFEGEHLDAEEELKRKRASQEAADQLIASIKGNRTTDQIQEELNQKKALHKVYLEIQENVAQYNNTISEKQQIEKEVTELSRKDGETFAKKKELDTLLEQEKKKFEDLQNVLFKKQLSASLHVHRENLIHGESCPLCGALDHPFVNEAPEFVSAISEQEKMLSDAKIALEVIEKQLKTTSSLYDTNKGMLNVKMQERLAVDKKLELSLREFNKVAGEYGFLIEEIKSLETAISLVKVTVSANEELLDNINQAEKKLTAAKTDVLAQQSAVAESKGRFLGQEIAVKSLNEQINSGRRECEFLNDEVTKLNQELLRLLLPLDIQLPAIGAEQQFQKNLEERRQAYATKVRKQQNLIEELAKGERAISDTQLRCNNLRQEALKLPKTFDVPNVQSDFYLEAEYAQKWHTFSDAKDGLMGVSNIFLLAKEIAENSYKTLKNLEEGIKEAEQALTVRLAGTEFKDVSGLRSARLKEGEVLEIEEIDQNLKKRSDQLDGEEKGVNAGIQQLLIENVPQGELLEVIKEQKKTLSQQLIKDRSQLTLLEDELKRDSLAQENYRQKYKELEEDRKHYATWSHLWELIGSHDGKKFRIFAQGLSLEQLIQRANNHLSKLNGRYRLHRIPDKQLDFEIQDLHQADITRPTASLSGGESFLVSLSLALGLSELAGRNIRIDSLFIDEGFGSLDSETLDIAISALESLQANNKSIGVISHLDLLKERITTQIHVEKIGCGVSKINFPASYQVKSTLTNFARN